jgi:hypothetical protein
MTTVTCEDRGGETLVVMHDLYPSKEALDTAIACGSLARRSSNWTRCSSPWAGASVGHKVVAAAARCLGR